MSIIYSKACSRLRLYDNIISYPMIPLCAVDTGVLTWMVAALLLVVLLLATAVLAVMVSLCVKRCRKNSKKKGSPTVPNEICVYYETSELDCVQMQRSPVYATVDEAKYN